MNTYPGNDGSELYQRAERRVLRSPSLSRHADFILADWSEGAGHWQWVATSPIREILEWVIAGDENITPSDAAALLGSHTSKRKADSSRENGKKGGRPKIKRD